MLTAIFFLRTAFSQYYRMYWLPYVGAYATASATCLTVLANYTLLAMTMERMFNAHNYMQKYRTLKYVYISSMYMLVPFFKTGLLLPDGAVRLADPDNNLHWLLRAALVRVHQQRRAWLAIKK